jgi:uncharacterized protein YjgD (DUF1641 family)
MDKFPKFPKKIHNNYDCELCDYNTVCYRDFVKHKSTLKHQSKLLEIDGNKNFPKKSTYHCQSCNYHTIHKNDFIKHEKSKKHLTKNQETCEKINNICCNCNRAFISTSGLWKHKKKCIVDSQTNNDNNSENEHSTHSTHSTTSNKFTPEMVFDIIKQSKELQNVLIEQNKELQNKLVEMASKQTTNINTQNNTTNQQFNLQFFLNETCKDAMNLVDFVNSLKLTPEDFETTGRLGFVDGISRIFIKELKKLNTEKLPIHCTDLKRETVYIKNNNIWEKENDEKHRLKWTIDRIADLNLNQHHEWQAKYPQCRENNTPENHKFVELTSVALGGRGKEQEDKFREKIMRNVLKEVVLDKKSNVLK